MFKETDIILASSTMMLPSKGEPYANKCDRVKIIHLNGADLSIITDRNLLRGGDMIDVLLASKVQKANGYDHFVPPHKMVVGDRTALLIQLRIHLNNLYKINAIDPDSGQPFETDFDLTQLVTKDVDIIPDADGLYDFTFKKNYATPVDIKFRLMTGEDEKTLRLLQQTGTYKESEYTRIKIAQTIVNVGGNEDRKLIDKFLLHTDLEELLYLNKYMNDVMHGIDLNISVVSPGGKPVATFLTFGYDFFTS